MDGSKKFSSHIKIYETYQKVLDHRYGQRTTIDDQKNRIRLSFFLYFGEVIKRVLVLF